MIKRALPFLVFLVFASPASARDNLGVYSDWASFRDDAPARCYAIAKPTRNADLGPFASVATWPKSDIRGQLHIRLSRATREETNATLTIGDQRFELVVQGQNAWAQDSRMDAAVVAAMRSAARMSVAAIDTNGSRFSDRYSLAGVATAMDAAVVGCASQ